MSPLMMECEAEAMKLLPAERATLAERLIASLDEISDDQNEQLWLNEADRRYREYKKGKISSRSAEAVLCDTRAAII